MSTSKLEAELWRTFSWYIRLKNSSGGRAKCITCGLSFPIKEMDAGHCIPRSSSYLKFDLRNVHPQCVTCNRHKDGRQKDHKKAIAELYGQAVLEELEAGKHKTWKLTNDWLAGAIRDYRYLIKMYEKNVWPPV